MISESVLSLAIVTVRTIAKSMSSPQDDVETICQDDEEEYEDAPPDQQVSPWITILGLIGSTLLCIALVRHVFGPDILSVPLTLLAVLVAMLLSVLAVRALGETDLNPVSGIGKISQVLFAGILPGGIAANLIAGGIAEAGAQQAGDLMQGKRRKGDLKKNTHYVVLPRSQDRASPSRLPQSSILWPAHWIVV
jgi:hypothetical protein